MATYRWSAPIADERMWMQAAERQGLSEPNLHNPLWDWNSFAGSFLRAFRRYIVTSSREFKSPLFAHRKAGQFPVSNNFSTGCYSVRL